MIAKTEPALTLRELEVVTLLVDGSTNKQIAKRCKIATSTAKFHVDNLFKKFAVDNRTKLAVAALRQRVVAL